MDSVRACKNAILSHNIPRGNRAAATMLVATAGHIDHGKTSLVRALTGVETDRLPEERARGISIDLGFAYWRIDEHHTIGFVDVPGHERFVHNMLAGVCAVDFALLVVAADDGVMPQSVEHVQILDLLDIARGMVAITKCDRVGQERVAVVREQVRQLLAPTSLAAAPMCAVSVVSGQGLAELGTALKAASTTLPAHRTGRNFRLAVDRAFTVTGAGTVVTGTVLDGTLELGAHLTLSPPGLDARVRGMQGAGASVNSVRAGERCALNLAGIELTQVHRGDWLLVPGMHAPTSRLEVQLRVLVTRKQGLRHNSPMHVHLGTADLVARVLLPTQNTTPPGGDAIAQLVLERPTVAATGDRFVLRDQSGRQLVGGGQIVDPFTSGERRHSGNRAAISAALRLGDPARSLAALLDISGYEVDTLRFERCFNLQAGSARALYQDAGVVLLGSTRTLALPANRVSEITAHLIELLRSFHRAQPEESGMNSRQLHAALTTPISTEAFLILLRDLNEKRQIELSGTAVRLPGHAPTIGPTDSARWQRALLWLQRRGMRPFTVRELADELRTSEASIKTMLHRRRSNGDVWRISEERFMLRQQVAALAASAAALAKEVGGKGFTAAQYRDVVGTGRNLAIQVLEFFDGAGVTYRNGDLRRMRPEYELVVGTAAPHRPPP
jgi:selenocysteine-specific elongation factor